MVLCRLKLSRGREEFCPYWSRNLSRALDSSLVVLAQRNTPTVFLVIKHFRKLWRIVRKCMSTKLFIQLLLSKMILFSMKFALERWLDPIVPELFA